MTNIFRSVARQPHRQPFEHRRGGAAFNPASLASSAFYDRTNLSTLFQGNKGFKPVTGMLEPVGLNLDMSQAVTQGPELLENGSFDDGSAGWVTVGTWAISAGVASVTATPSNSSLTSAPAGLAVGQYAHVNIVIDEVGAGGVEVFIGGANNTGYISAPGAYDIYGVVTFNNSISIRSTPNSVLSISSVSVKRQFGNQCIQSDAAKKPTLVASALTYGGAKEMVVTFPASLGAGCTVCRSIPATGASITTGVTIGATFTDNVDAYALAIFTAAQWAALSAADIAKLTAWLNSKAALKSVAVVGDSVTAAYSGSNAAGVYLFGADVNTLSVPGDTISMQKAVWVALDPAVRAGFQTVVVQIGLNDLNPAEPATTAIARIQDLIDTINADNSGRLLLAQMTPCRSRLITIYGGTDGPIAYQKWLDMNLAISGKGGTPITGADAVAVAHVAALNDGSGNLSAAYGIGDGIHTNNAGRQINAEAWQPLI